MQPRTMFEKVWDSHLVREEAGEPSLIYVDLHLVHEVTSPQGFAMLRERGLSIDDLVPAPVAAYIAAHKLYTTAPDKPLDTGPSPA